MRADRCLAALALLVAPALGIAQGASPRRAPPASAKVARLAVDRPTVVSYFVMPAGATDTSEELAVAADDWSYAMATLRDSLAARGVALALVTEPTLRLSSRGTRRPVTITLGERPASGYVFVRPGARLVVRRGYMDPDSVLAMAGALVGDAALKAAPNAAPATAPSGTLVVSNMNDGTATVIDAATGRVRATLPTGEGPHEVAISRDGRLAVVSNYGPRGKPGSTLTVIDVARAAVARTLAVAGHQRPHGMAFLPGDTLLVVTSEGSRSLLLVDVRDGRVVAERATNGRASHMVALTAAGDRAFTANIADNTISGLDLSGRDTARVIPVGRAPEGIAVTPDGARVWVGSNQDGTVTVVDARRGVATDTLRGFGVPYRIAISPDGRLAVVTDPAKAEVRVVSTADRRTRFTIAVPADSLVNTAEVPNSPSPEGVAISRDGRWAFVTLQGRNRVITIDLARGAITAYAPTGTWSDGIGYSPVVGGGATPK